DVVGFDFYPVYAWCHPEWISGEADATRELAERYAPRKPVYSWIEAAATSGESCAGRGPLANEVRAEVWMTITNGAKAIGYFTHSWNPWYSQFRVDPAVQEELRRTDRQIRSFAPVLLGMPIEVRQRVLTPGGRVDFIVRQRNGALYVFAVNVGRAPVSVRFAAPELARRTVQVFEEGRTIKAGAGGFVDTFAPLAVHAYVVPPR